MDPRLWRTFLAQLTTQLEAWPQSPGDDKGLVIFQCDNRPRGSLGCEPNLNASAKLWDDYMRAEGLHNGKYLFFDLGDEHFSELPTYWACPVLMAFIRIIFPDADLHYVDSDAFVLPGTMACRIATMTPPE